MKRFITCFMFLSVGYFGNAQTNAPDVIPVDCQSNPHNLYNELDAGKIIVIGWTMPCSVCAPPLLDVHNEVLNYAISNPGVVELWIFDDQANTDCHSVETWCIQNGINNATYFSDNVMSMLDFGGIGMPKVVVVGCTSHHIYYIGDNNPTGADVGLAINEALADQSNGCVLNVKEGEGNHIEAYPNPASDFVNLRVDETDEFKGVSIYSISGRLIKEHATIDVLEGNGEYIISVADLEEGAYIFSLRFAEQEIIRKIQVDR